MVDWSTLPYDILEGIVLKFEDIVDCICLRAVCHTFNDAYTMVKERSQSKILPWLFLAENTNVDLDCFRKLFSITTNKCYRLSLSETFGRRCWGSSYGWIVTIGLDLEMHIFNPLTGARIRLPHQSTLPNCPEEAVAAGDFEWLRKCFVRRAILLRIPDEFVVMVVYGARRDVAFAKLGDQTWTPIQGLGFDKHVPVYKQFAHDFCYWDGKILVLCANGRIGYCDINSSSPCVLDLFPAPSAIRDNRYEIFSRNQLYIVNSNSDLLIVVRYKIELLDEDNGYETIDFAVFRLDFNTKDWKEIDDVGNIALFVGDSHSMSFEILGCRSVVRNRIYFTDDYSEYWEMPREFGGHDMGAFDIKDMDVDIVPYYEGGNFRSNFCTPFWFIPMLNR